MRKRVANSAEKPRDVRNLVIVGVLTYLVVCLFGLAQIPDVAKAEPDGDGRTKRIVDWPSPPPPGLSVILGEILGIPATPIGQLLERGAGS